VVYAEAQAEAGQEPGADGEPADPAAPANDSGAVDAEFEVVDEDDSKEK